MKEETNNTSNIILGLAALIAFGPQTCLVIGVGFGALYAIGLLIE